MSSLYSNSIFWIDTDKVKPNPYQPRRDFDETRLQNLADSIKQYGVLQPLTVSRVEVEKNDGGITTEYELIAGERRLRAAKLAQVSQVPVIIRVGDTSMMKLELAIIENLQREDLNSVDRARAFSRLVEEFKFTHNEIAKKIGRSREYVSNTLRILSLSEEILSALSEGKITEGHTRPILMLVDHPEEQMVLFKEILYKKITVREAERLARKIAYDRVRKKEFMPDPEITELEEEFQDKLGTRVHIDRKELGGQIKIDFFSIEDLRTILDSINKSTSEKKPEEMLQNFINKNNSGQKNEEDSSGTPASFPLAGEDDRTKNEIKEDDSKLYDISNFSI
ncbi:MAG: ParB-like protein partition protein [Candidatus Nomurabacteria bacterium GW2011_GWB1_35_20]|uniref:ParB-like protein partition protein n=3 Tax=Candidatus Nomuraibacteriota TaxID=1752729 RepID=A0A0G0GCI9_9BACT|nr:MAG: ParB-like protein partition protein [Candidatus Nomurabacteria bacterium GW2011_GWB1_35_20]KKP76449.1 MAG: ParB-like protein partition protein [Parcubacteria group bacterium GW2011_GWC1_35_21]KKP78144.1 MAG: ParB-like protein partition protein [Candidatus Nomurabacteria bacterium GW2011_GWC2_35_35]KKP88475.1 MAG: ParB-like protein partition protein [Candidatus Nomurabacteria bacterium GW2011_GWA2_35_80]KKP97560.1 MAG: ParB-like protein partition protein [Candidatus Nomurabacteria bacter